MSGPSTSISTEFLMTLHAPLDPPQVVNSELEIYNVAPGGWVKGPKIRGKIIAPAGDWFRTMPDGSFKLDVRMSIRADDESIIFVTYGGRMALSEDAARRAASGEALGSADAHCMISLTFETASKKYSWLNEVVAVGKMASTKSGEGSYITYDIFAVM